MATKKKTAEETPQDVQQEEEQREVKVLSTIVGNIGQPPVRKSTSKGDVVNFSVATNPTSDKDADPVWVRVGVWNEALQGEVMKLKKGNRVAVVGVQYTNDYGENMTGYRVGRVDWLYGEKPSAATDQEEAGLGW